MKTDQSLKEKIVSLLMKNSRKSLREIAKEIEVSTTTVSRIVKELEKEGIILKYTLQVDWKKLGYDAVCCLQIITTPNADLEKVGNAIKKINSVKQVFYTTGDTSFSAYAVGIDAEDTAKTIQELRNIEGVERVISHIVLKIF